MEVVEPIEGNPVARRQHVPPYVTLLEGLIHRDSYSRYVRLGPDQDLVSYYEALVRLMQVDDPSVEIVVFGEEHQIHVQFVPEP